MVQIISIICLVAALALPGLATTIDDVTSGLNDVISKVNTLNAEANAVPTTGSDSVANAAV